MFKYLPTSLSKDTLEAPRSIFIESKSKPQEKELLEKSVNEGTFRSLPGVPGWFLQLGSQTTLIKNMFFVFCEIVSPKNDSEFHP